MTCEVSRQVASEAQHRRVMMLGVEIDAVSFDEAAQLIVERAEEGGPPSFVVTLNAQITALLHNCPRYDSVCRKAYLSVADGMPLVWAGTLLGRRLRGRVNGTNLVEELCRRAAHRGLKLFFLGGRPGAARSAASVMKRRYPRLIPIECHCPPFGFENHPDRVNEIADRIRAARPDILFVGFGAPKQEYWIHENYRQLGVPVSIGVGGSFDLLSGQLPRAPKWMQNLGMEWLFRLTVEPRRLFKRYAVTNPIFVCLVAMELFTAIMHRSYSSNP